MSDFLSVRIEEIAVWVSPSDDAAAFFGRDLAAALGHKPEARRHVIGILHKTASRRDGWSPNGGAKLQVLKQTIGLLKSPIV